MKFPKHRANCFVVRRIIADTTTVIGVFPTYEGADAFMGASEQAWKDNNLAYNPDFDVVMTTYYDE
jgi:hypothetical protein